MVSDKIKKIAILYSEAKREYFPTEEQYISEAEVLGRAETIAPFFERMGYIVKLFPGNDELPDNLKSHKPDLVLNLVDSIRGRENYSSIIPATLDLFNIPYIGSGSLGMAINSNKFLTRKLLEQAGLPLPRYQLFNTSNDPIDPHLKFPLIAKLNEIHGSVSIDQSSISENETQLRSRLRYLINLYKQPVLAEEFIVGRELVSFVFKGVVRKVYIGERVFWESDNKYKLATFAAVWQDGSYDYKKEEGHGLLEDYSRQAFDVLKMEDYAKFEIRQDESGRYYFIDANTNPSFGPNETITTILKMYGIDFEEILKRLIVGLNRKTTGSESIDIKNDSDLLNGAN